MNKWAPGIIISDTPMRKVVGRSSPNTNGWARSDKAPQGFCAGESKGELEFMMFAEMDPNVTAVRPQPCVIPLLERVQPDKSVKLKLKGHVFWRSDAYELNRKIRDVSQRVETVPEGFEPYEIASKTCADAEYKGSDFLLDILSGAVPTVRTSPCYCLSDLYVNIDVGRLRSLEKRMAKIIRTDQFGATFKVEAVLSSLWPKRPEKLTIPTNRNLRERNIIRFKRLINRTEGRERPIYWYSIVDHMLRARRKFGSSILPAIDEQLAELNKRNPSREEDLIELIETSILSEITSQE